MKVATKTMRTASVAVTWSASGVEKRTIDIPDDIPPDKVREWIEDEVDKVCPNPWPLEIEDWYLDSDPKIEGEWVPPEDHPLYAEWLERERLKPLPGQRDIFGGEVAP